LIFQKYLTNQGVLKMAKIKMKNSVTVAETFHGFLMAKKATGDSEKTLLTYGQHFSAVSKHLSPDTPMDGLNKADLEAMIASMRDVGLVANSIKSYTRTLKSFLSRCNEDGITRLNKGTRTEWNGKRGQANAPAGGWRSWPG
jgi:site-specific recombinase XerD